MRVKICGLTSAAAVTAAAEAGAAYLGFVFFPRSPRAVTLEQARGLVAAAPDGPVKVALTVDADDALLLVDDVFDTGHTIEAVIAHLQAKARLNTPHEIRVAVPYYKPSRNRTERVPDYYVHETEQWIKFPHSLEGLSEEEVARHRPALHDILQSVREREE